LKLKKLALILFIIILAVLIVLNREQFTQGNLSALLAYLGPWAPVVFILIYAIVPVLFIPGTLMTLLGGFLFGFYWGFLYSLIGGTIGASLAFLVGRYLAEDWTEQHSHAMLIEVQRGIEKDGWRYIAFTRLVPVFPYSILNYAFGLTQIHIWTFTITSFICLIPGTLAYSYIGHVGQEAAEGSQGMLIKISIVFALILVISFARKKAKAKV
jgi:uncharacterized membrane protein YdjX (TVP38/TMEM64 family)